MSGSVMASLVYVLLLLLAFTLPSTVDAIDLVPRESPVQTVAGHDVSIAVDIKRGSLNLSVKWSLGHTGLEIVTNDKYIVNNTQLPLVTLTILNAVEEDDNTYTLTVSNDTFTASLSVDVNVQVTPSFDVQPTDIAGTVLDTVTLLCASRGSPPPHINWYKDGMSVMSSSAGITVVTNIGEAVTSSVIFIELSLATAGDYFCNASNFLVTDLFNLSTVATVTSYYAPNVTVAPARYIANETFTAVFMCSVFGVPLPNVTWSIENEILSVELEENGIEITEIDSNNTRTSVLNFTSVLSTDATVYTCTAVNDITNVLNTPTSGIVTLVVQVPPNITALSTSPLYATEGRSITLTFSITAADPPVNTTNIKWYFTNTASTTTDITNSLETHYTLSANRHSLTIEHTSVSRDVGLYTIYATNEAGTATSSIELLVESSPQVFRIPEDQFVVENDTAMFECLAVGTPALDQNWYYDDMVIASDEEKYNIDVFGTLFVYNVEFEDHGIYTCTFNNSLKTLSLEAELKVQVHPTILEVSIPANVTAGSYVTLICNTTGYPLPLIRWLKDVTILNSNDRISLTTETFIDNSGLYNVLGYLRIKDVILSDNSLYSCHSQNNLVKEQITYSDEFQLNIQYPPDVTAAATAIIINQTDDAIINCTVFSIPLSNIEWNFNGTLINSTEADKYIIDETTVTNGSDISLLVSTLIIQQAIRAVDQGLYTCNASNGIANLIGTNEFTTISLTIQVPPTISSVSITPSNIGVVNESVTITFSITDAYPFVSTQNIQWTFNDTLIDKNGSYPRYKFSSDFLSLTIRNLQHTDEGFYSLIAANEAGSNESTVFLEIEAPPVIIIPPHNISQLEGYSVTLNCIATAEPHHTVQWFYIDTELPNNTAKYSILLSNGSLIVFDVKLNDTGRYTCIASNVHGNDSASAYLEIQVIPRFVQDPSANTRLIGDNITISCTAYAIPVSSISWLKDGIPITITSSNTVDGYLTSSNLTLVSLNFSNTGAYSCTASNSLVSIQYTNSSTALLTIHMPVIITSSPDNSTVNETDTVDFVCIAKGLPAPSIVWRTDQGHINISSDININTTIQQILEGPTITRSVLTFNAIKDTDAVTYTCTASNVPAGNVVSVSSSFSVTVQTQPVVQFVNENDTAIGVEFHNRLLTVNVTRDLPKVTPSDIQWYFQRQGERHLLVSNDHYIISSDRLSLTLVNLKLNDSGNYTVEASNIVGTGAATVSLEVQRAPVIITPLNPLILLAGTSATFNCNATAIPRHTTKWLKDNTELMNSTKYAISGLGTATSTLIINSIELADRGNYTCIAENIHGNDSFTDQLYVQAPPSFIMSPEPLMLIASNTVVITCNVSGYPRPSVDILKDNMLLTSTNGIRSQGSLSDGMQFSSISITLYSLTYNDSANYTCNATNYLASVETRTSSSVPFLVQYPPDITVSPASIVVNETDQVTLLCSVFGIPASNITWINDSNVQITDSINNGVIISYGSSPHPSGIPFNISNLTILSVTKQFESNYSCIASNGVPNLVGTLENGSISLTVQVPPDVVSLRNESLGVVNNSVTLSFMIERSSPPVTLDSIHWTFTDISNSVTRSIINSSTTVLSPDLLNLTLVNVQHSDEGDYSLTANNPAGIHTATVYLRVEAAPVFLQTPQDASRLQRETAIFNCSAIAEPVHSVVWEKEGVAIAQFLSIQDREKHIVTFSRFDTIERGKSITVNDSKYSLKGEKSTLYGQLTIYNTDLSDARNYTCIVSNVHGTISAHATLSVQVTPEFVDVFEPVINSSVGANVTLTCTAKGLPVPDIVWYFNGEELDFNTSGNIRIEVAESTRLAQSVLSINFVNLSNQGIYWCNASNFQFVYFREMSPLRILNVHYPANVSVLSPTALLRKATEYALFTCIVSGIPPPIVQWSTPNGTITEKRGKVSITETTINSADGELVLIRSQLLILNLTNSDQQLYTCTGKHSVDVNNFIGAVNNASASLLVRVSPRVIAVTSSSIVTWNTSHTITFTVTKSQPQANITWEFTSSVSGDRRDITDEFNGRYFFTFTESIYNLTIYPVRIEDRGTYHLIASNVAGSSSSEVTIEQIYAVPYISERNNQRVSVSVGDSISFNCTSDGIPQPTLTWYRNGTLLTGGGSRWFIDNLLLDGISARPELESNQSVFSQLTLINASRFDQGSLITCQANNFVTDPTTLTYTLLIDGIIDYCNSVTCYNGGTCYSTIGSFKCVCTAEYTGPSCQNLSSTVDYVPPTISISPQSVTNLLYSPVNLTCTVQGSPVPLISWYKDGSEINGEHSGTYYISELTVDRRGLYHCTATSYFTDPPQIVSSDTVLVTITNIAQYLMSIATSTSILEQSLINKLNQDFSGRAFHNNTAKVFSIKSHNINNLLITVITSSTIDSSLQQDLYKLFNNSQFNITNIQRFDGCLSEVTNTTFIWSETNIGTNATFNCSCGSLSLGTGRPIATRYCTGNFTSGAVWSTPDITQCDFNEQLQLLCNLSLINSTFSKLEQLQLTTNNEMDRVQVLVTVRLLEDLLNESINNNTFLNIYLDILEHVTTQNVSTLREGQSLSNTSSRILQMMDNLLANIHLSNVTKFLVITRPSFVLAVQLIDSLETSTFSVSDTLNVSFSNRYSNRANATVSLPPILNALNDSIRVTHASFVNGNLFPLPGGNRSLESIVVATSLINQSLSLPVNITYDSLKISGTSTKLCSFMDFALNDGKGGWSTVGCELALTTSDNRTVCSCNHLTHFALIVEPVVVPMPDTPIYVTVLQAISVFAVTISSVFLIITLILYLGTWKLRTKHYAQLVVNVSLSTLLLCIVYIGSLYAVNDSTACVVFSAFMHYAFIVAVIAVFVKVLHVMLQGIWPPLKYYTLVAIISTWTIPVIIVAVCAGAGHAFYSSVRVCLPSELPFYIGIVALFILLWIISGIFLIIITIILFRVSLKNFQYLSTLAVYTICSIAAVFLLAKANVDSPVAAAILELLFLLSGGFLGLYMFVVYCLLSEDVKVIWKEKCIGSRIAGYRVNRSSNGTKDKEKTSLSSSCEKEDKKDEGIELKSVSPEVHATDTSTSIDV